MAEAVAPWPRTMATFVGSFLVLTALSRIAPYGGEPPASVLLATGESLLLLRAVARWTGRRGAAAAVFLGIAVVHAIVAVGVARAASHAGGVALLVLVQVLVWGLAEAISRTGRLHGGASVYAMFAWIDIIRQLHDAAGRFGAGEAPATVVLAPLTLLLPMLLAFGGALALPNGRWPLRVFAGVEARSGLDLVLLVLAAGLLAAFPARALGAILDVPHAVSTAAVATVVILAASRSYLRAREPGKRDLRLIPPLFLLPTLAGISIALGYHGR